MDTVTPAVRSRIMASVGQKNTGGEVLLRKALHRLGLRYKLHDRSLPGSPDLVLPRFKAVVFVHGCYWHSHGCYRSTTPKTRRKFWTDIAAAPEKDDVLREFRILKKDETAEDLSFRTVFDRVRNRCRKDRTVTDGLARWEGGLSECELYDYAGSSDDAAVVLLPIAWCLALERAPQGGTGKTGSYDLSGAGGIYQIGISAVVRPKIEEFLQQDRSYRDVMAELVMRTVQQHLRVAYKRFSTPRGKDVSVLIADTEAWSRNRRFRPGRTASRLSVAIDWLSQLRLTSADGLTKTGERTLKRSLDVLENS